ncbi:MAG TPA: AAA family ATPase [Blastocatellia bacterium]|nr:AAA family ATPase [Blastocatellia bacterium]
MLKHFVFPFAPRCATRQLSPLAENILRILHDRLRDGHTCISSSELADRVIATPVALQCALAQLQSGKAICVKADYIAFTPCVAAEETIAAALQRIGTRARIIPVESLPAGFATKLSEEQRQAIRTLAQAPVAILTGAPGTGKTSTIQSLIEVFTRANYRVRLAAPTGRAAQRLQETTGHPATTLHRLLADERLQLRTWWQRWSSPPEVILVDEASMVDVFLMSQLISICTSATRLILVGDPHQLASIGPGQVLLDLIESQRVTVVRLITNYRQTKNSRIVDAAESLKAGGAFDLPAPGTEKSDSYFIEAGTVAEIEHLVVKAVTQSLPTRCGANPRTEIQVLTPKHGGALDTVALNEAIRTALSAPPAKKNVDTSHIAGFMVGDRVLHTKNNYALGVFNGQCGSVHAVESNRVMVYYGAREVTYTAETLAQLTHRFALSIHRSQGSEYPFVILPIHESQQPLLTRELLYTAMTRAKQMVVLIGSRRALEIAIHNTKTGQRQTLLPLLLAPPSVPTSLASVLPNQYNPRFSGISGQ